MGDFEDETLLVFLSVLSPHRGPVSALKWFTYCSLLHSQSQELQASRTEANSFRSEYLQNLRENVYFCNSTPTLVVISVLGNSESVTTLRKQAYHILFVN